MSLNFLGLGASIGVKDLGASKMAAGLTSAFGGVSTALAGIASQSLGAATGLGAIAALAGKGLHNLGSEVASFAMAGRELTTSFEAEAQAHAVSTRRMVAQTGVFGKELDKLNAQAAGMAHGLGMSDQTAAHAVSTFSQFKDELKALGVESALSAGKVEEGLGVSIRDVAFQMHRLKDGLKLSQKDMEELGKSFSSTGMAIHDVAAPFKSMDAAMDLAVRRTNLVRQGLSSIGGKDSIKSINSATRALFVLTGDAKGAQESALGLEDKLISSMENFRNMFTGNSNDLDAFLYNTSVVTGDVQKAFEAAADGPDAFIKQFGTVIARLKKDGKSTEDVLKFFGGQMSEALGPELANRLLLAVSNADEAKMQMIKSNKEITKSLGEMGKEAWRSTKTLADQYNMAVGAGMAAFRDLGRGAARAFVTDTGRAFKEFNAQAKELVKKGGPLGAIVTKLSEMSSIGAVAILPQQWRASAAVFGELYTQLSPSLGAITQMSGALTSLFNPLTLISGALAGFVALVIKNKTETNSWADAIVAAVGDVRKFFDEWSQKILKWADSFDWARIFKILADGLASAIKGFTRVLSGEKSPVESAMSNFIGPTEDRKTFAGVGGKIIDALKKSFAGQDWSKLFGDLGSQLRKYLISAVRSVFNIPESDVQDDNQVIGKAIGKALSAALDFAIVVLKDNAETQTKIWGVMFEIGKAVVKALPAVKQGIESELGDWTLVKYLFPPNWIPALVEALMGIPKALKDIWVMVKADAVAFWHELMGGSIIPDMIGQGIEHIKEHFTNLLKFVETIGNGMASAFGSVIGKVKGLFGGGKAPSEAIEGDMTESLKTIQAATDKMKEYVQKQLFEAVTDGVTKAFTEAFKKIQEGSKDFFEKEVNAFQKFAEWATNLFKKMWTTILDDMDIVGQAMSSIMGQVEKDISNMKSALDQLKAVQDQVDPTKRDEQGKLIRKETEPQALLREIIDNPQWSAKYMDMFERRMGELIGSVNGLKGNMASAKGITPAQGKTEIRKVPDWFGQTNVNPDPYAGR